MSHNTRDKCVDAVVTLGIYVQVHLAISIIEGKYVN
jgi:hypothetical protein